MDLELGIFSDTESSDDTDYEIEFERSRLSSMTISTIERDYDQTYLEARLDSMRAFETILADCVIIFRGGVSLTQSSLTRVA
jgi:hypothetical protein